MNQDSDEKNLRELFQSLKRADEPRAPTFERTVNAARRLADAPRADWRWIPVATAVAVVVVGTCFVLFAPRPRPPKVVASASLSRALKPMILVSQWKSPTDFLLQPPDAASVGSNYNLERKVQ